MFLVFLRSLFFILIIFSILVDIDIPVILHTPVNQLLIGILILIIIILIDEILGFLIGLLFLIIYFKYYQKLINNKTSNSNYLKEPLLDKNTINNYPIFNKNEKFDDVKPSPNNKTDLIQDHYIKFSNGCIEMPYISNELLENAQNNIYDINNYNNEIRTNNNTYGVQGLNSDAIHYPGLDLTIPNYHIYK